ncbi:MAG: hypothetical protein L3I99_01195 [Sulfurimonas sp.]|nr:hypothetical protein [Sulfurimonas sp.]
MAGVHFSYKNFKQLIRLNIGISERLDENRAESFTLLYCDFSSFTQDEIDTSLRDVLRNSDSIINHDGDYFFVLPYTDKYGTNIVKSQFDDFFGRKLNSFLVSYPVDGETAEEIIEFLQNSISRFCKKDLIYLDELYELNE